jgi:hypothetical protein
LLPSLQTKLVIGIRPNVALAVQALRHCLQNMAEPLSNKGRAGIIDMIAHDPKTDEAVLVMNELEPWNGSDDRLFQLQERFNAYVSFLLDGEFAEWDPNLARKRVRIEVRCAHMPDNRAIELMGQIRDQLAHQEIDVQVIVKETEARQD